MAMVPSNCIFLSAPKNACLGSKREKINDENQYHLANDVYA